MKSRILALAGVCLLLFAVGGIHSGSANAVCSIQEDPEMTELKEKQKNTMVDIGIITKALANYITDEGVLPKQDGTYDEKSEFFKALSPHYVKVLPVKDAWGNKFVYHRVSQDEYTLISRGRDGAPGSTASTDYFDPNADTVLISGVFVASHQGTTVIVGRYLQYCRHRF